MVFDKDDYTKLNGLHWGIHKKVNVSHVCFCTNYTYIQTRVGHCVLRLYEETGCVLCGLKGRFPEKVNIISEPIPNT